VVSGSPRSSVLRGTPTPHRSSPTTRLLSPRGTSVGTWVRPRAHGCRARPEMAGDVSAPRSVSLRRKWRGLPGSWGALWRTCPALRPRRARRARPTGPSKCCLPPSRWRRPHGYSLSRLNHTAHTLAVYPSQHAVTHDHARLASDCLARLGWTGLDTRGAPNGVSSGHESHAGFAWRTENSNRTCRRS